MLRVHYVRDKHGMTREATDDERATAHMASHMYPPISARATLTDGHAHDDLTCTHTHPVGP
eukprot:2239275-Prymnesium_polylepis.1